MDLNRTSDSVKKPSGWGTRHTVAVLGFMAFGISYAMRFNLSLAIVAMVKTKGNGHSSSNNNVSLASTASREETCAHLIQEDPQHLSTSGVTEGEFEWNEAEQGFILGSFFWGYVLTQLPGGMLAHKYGGKWPLGLGLLLTAVFAILTPILARTHVALLVFARIMQGLGEGVTTPAMHSLLAEWAPPNERSILCSIVYAGAQFGTAVTMVLSGYLIHGGVMGGWPSVFYVIGLGGLVWFVLWTFLMADSPAKHPRISLEEKHYIEMSIGTEEAREKGPTPWKEIFTSLPLWAILVGHVGHAYGLYTLLTLLPTYLKTVLQYDIKQNSWLSAFPYIVMWLMSILVTQIADFFIRRKIFSTVAVRKGCQTIAHVGSAIALIGASYSGCDRLTTISLLTVSVGINGAIYAGYVVNHVDIAPNYAGVLMGITNTFANLTGFTAPYVAGLIINEDPSLENWQYVFFIAAGIYLTDVIFYGLFAKGTEQPWNQIKKCDKMDLENMKNNLSANKEET